MGDGVGFEANGESDMVPGHQPTRGGDQHRKARVARNPRSGETVKVKATKVPVFRAGQSFRDVVAGKAAAPKLTAPRGTKAAARSAGAKTTAKATTAKATTARGKATTSRAKAPAKAGARKR